MRFLATLALIAPLAAHALSAEPLAPEEAFTLSAKALDARTVEVRYKIADDYYLYKDKLRFELEPASAAAGSPVLPPGKVKKDEFFGEVETYRKEVVVKLPVAPGAGEVKLKSTAQGCWDGGVCYPPLTQTVPVKLAAADAGAGFSLRSLLPGLGGQPQLLPPEEAFKVKIGVKDARTLVADIQVAKDYYLYKDKIAFTVKPGRIEKVTLPAAEPKVDPNFGKTEIYRKPFQAEIRLAEGAGGKVTVTATVQGCAEKQGVCYPPLARDYEVVLPSGAKAQPSPATPEAPAPAAASTPAPMSVTPPTVAAAPAAESAPAGEDSRAADLLRQGSFGLIVAGFFGFGLLLALTPCVFPMIPILSGIIVGEGHQVTKSRGFVLSLTYVLGMALTYAIAGVIAGMSGALLSNALQNPWVLSGFALVFVALAFSMFGFYDLQMPSFIQSRLTNSSNRQKGGSLAGVFVMGVLSGLIVGPCVAAPLAGALLYIGQTGDTVLGGTALFAMALGMGAPLLLIGLSAGALLPKAGAWMQAVKNFFGVLLLGVAIWLVSPVIPPLAHMLAWAVLLTVSAIYMHALDPLPVNASGFARFWKGLGVVALVCGLALLVGALSGSRDILQPLSGLRATAATGPAQVAANPLRFEKVANIAELDAKIAQNKGKFIMLDFYAEWCVSCKEFERFTLGDARVQARLADWVLLKADVTDYNGEHKALLKRFDLFGPPGILFYDPSGKLVLKLVGEEGPDKFLSTLERVRANG